MPHLVELPMLHLAAHQGWMDIVIDLITKYKCDINSQDSNGRTPLHYAVINNHLEVVRYLIIEQHCDPMTRDNDGHTPLHIACRHSHIDIVHYLLSTGKVNPLARNKLGKSPMLIIDYTRLPLLHLAAQKGWMDIAIDLITKYKCDINSQDSNGRTPLYYAVINNHLEVVRYFINEQHCDPMTKDNDGDTPLHIACHLSNIDIVHYLLSTGKVNPLASNKYGKSPMLIIEYRRLPMLHLAARQGWMDIAIDLITKYKCDINSQDSNGRTPLYYAVINNHLEVVKYLIDEQHCDPMTRDNDGDTPLHIACRHSHIDIVRYLLSTGKVNPLARNKNGKSPVLIIDYTRLPMLHLAAHQGWMDIAIDLITKYKCEINRKDSKGCNPLFYAARNNHLEVVRYFINEQHCDPMTKDNYGNTPLHIAVINNHLEVVRYFINEQHCDPMTRDNDGDTPLHIACRHSHIDIVRYLLSTGKVNPLARNKNGKSPVLIIDYTRLPMLHLAAHQGWMDIAIDLITKYKCDINSKDSNGRTPLYYAVINNHLEVVKYLIDEQHCDPMTRDNDGDTPLHIACRHSHIDIVRYLLSTGKVNPLARNKNGKSPVLIIDYTRLPMLHLAAHQGWMDIAIDLITKYKCDINSKDSNGRTPLYYAVINNHLEVVKYLIDEQHCDPMTRDNDCDTPLHIACRHSHIDIVHYLLSTGKVNPLARNKNGKSPVLIIDYTRLPMLHLAAHQGWMDIAIDLITKYKCEINRKDSKGCNPLFYAARNNHLEVVRYFINEQHCDPMTKDNYGNTPLHIAVINNHLEVVRYFINEQHCDPMTRDNYGNTPLHIAARNNHREVVKYLINEQHCDPMTRDNDGDTPLHIACHLSNIDIVHYLLSTGKVNPLASNKYGKSPMLLMEYIRLPMIHLAAHQGWTDVFIALITNYKCDIAIYRDTNGHTPLYYAISNNHMEVVRYIINTQHYHPMTKDNVQYLLTTGQVAKNNNKEMPKECVRQPLLHMAAAHGWLDIVDLIISKYQCNINRNDSNGCTPLHYTVINNHLEVVRYFINEQHCDSMTKDNDGNTLLHIACSYGNTNVVQYLLSTGKVDLLAENNNKETPVDIATQINSYDLLKLFQSFPQCEKDFPVHTYTKLILTGYSGTGKTTISQMILLLATKTGISSWFSSGRVPDVECLTAGIIPLHVESKVNEVGNMVMYDFAGQQEYYSSHGAVLERIMRNSAAIFVCIVDLSQSMDKISESIHYWISFIENACSSAQGSSHVIIVGSHADLVKLPQELKEKSLLVESIAESRAKQLTYGGFISMDCRLSKTKQARYFSSLLLTSQQAILSSQPSMTLYCHVLYAFLCGNLRKTGCTLQELTCALASEKDFSPDSTVLTKLLTSLNDKGLILFIQNQEHPLSSWVVVEKETLLREVNGTLFAPEHFKQYRQIASNTGIVPIATLEELFPQYSSEMLVGCLESMEFCHPVDLTTLQATNLNTTTSPPPSGANYLFFPSLVKEHRPSDLPSPMFGWCLGCSDPHQFFSNRFLHVLLLRLAFTFSMASTHLSPSSSLWGLERKCKVWQNGICWKSGSGVSTIVEIVDRNRWVIVLVSEKTREAAQTCSSVIRMILDLQHQLCSVVTTCECLISPSLLNRYPFDALPDTDLFDLPSVAKAMLLRQPQHKFLLDRKEGMNTYSTDEALSCEPYYLLQPSSVCRIFNQSMASQRVPDPLLQEVLKYCLQKPQDYKELRECVDKYSIFAGRNPLVSFSVQAVL